MDIEVTKEDQRGAILREGAEKSVQLIQEASQRPWRTINDCNKKVRGVGDCDRVEFKRGYGQVR